MAAQGVPGVDGQVHHRRLQLALVGADEGQVAAVVGDQPHILAQEPAEQHLELADQLAQRQGLALHRLLAGEGQELAHQVGGTHPGLADLGQGLVAGVPHRMAVQQLVQPQLDGGEQVVEVVGHAPGQLADGLHLLVLGQLQFQLLLVGHVQQEGRHPPPGVSGQVQVRDPRLARGLLRRQSDLHRSGRAGGQPLPQVGHARGIEDGRERNPRPRRAVGQTAEGRIEVGHHCGKGVAAAEQAGPEGRGGGEGIEAGGDGGVGSGLRRACHPLGGLRHRRGRSGTQADKNAAAVDPRSADDLVAGQGALRRLARLCAPENGVDHRAVGPAAGQAPARPHGGAPGVIGTEGATIDGGHCRRVRQCIDQILQRRLVQPRLRPMGGGEGEDPEERGPRHADQQQQRRPAGLARVQDRRGQGQHRHQEQPGRGQGGPVRERDRATTASLGPRSGRSDALLGHGGVLPKGLNRSKIMGEVRRP